MIPVPITGERLLCRATWQCWVEHVDADRVDWAAQVETWPRQALQQHQSLLAGRGGHGGYHQHHGRHGSGMGGVVAGAVGGAALGFAAGMVAEEVFDSFGDDVDGGYEE